MHRETICAHKVTRLRERAEDRLDEGHFIFLGAGAPSDPRQPGPVADALAKLEKDGLVRAERAAMVAAHHLDRETNSLSHKRLVHAKSSPMFMESGTSLPPSKNLVAWPWLHLRRR